MQETVTVDGAETGFDGKEKIPAQVYAAGPQTVVLVQDGHSPRYQAWLNRENVGIVYDETEVHLGRRNFSVWSLRSGTKSGLLSTTLATLEDAVDALRTACGVGGTLAGVEPTRRHLKDVTVPFIVYGTTGPTGVTLASDRTVSGDPIKITRLGKRNRRQYGYTPEGVEVCFGGPARMVWISPVVQDKPATIIVTPVSANSSKSVACVMQDKPTAIVTTPAPASSVVTPNTYTCPDLPAMQQAVEAADRALTAAAGHRARVQCTIIAATVRTILADGNIHAPCDAASIAFHLGDDGAYLPHPVYSTVSGDQYPFPINDDFHKLCALVGGLTEANRTGWEPLCTTRSSPGAASTFHLDLAQAAPTPTAPLRQTTVRPDASRRAAALLVNAFHQKYAELPEFVFALYARGRYTVEIRGYMTDDQVIDFEPGDLAMLIGQLAAALSHPGGPPWDRALVAGPIEDMTVAWSLQDSFPPLSDSAATQIIPGWFTEEPPASPLTDHADKPITVPLSARTKAELARYGITFT